MSVKKNRLSISFGIQRIICFGFKKNGLFLNMYFTIELFDLIKEVVAISALSVWVHMRFVHHSQYQTEYIYDHPCFSHNLWLHMNSLRPAIISDWKQKRLNTSFSFGLNTYIHESATMYDWIHTSRESVAMYDWIHTSRESATMSDWIQTSRESVAMYD